MKSAICTLWEGNYHHGLAVLTNSLVAWGYRGVIYAGYRGKLPAWAQPVSTVGGTSVLQVNADTTLVFIPLATSAHFTNHKPTFMLELLDGPARDCDALFYFDPDIVMNGPWTLLEEWVSCGIALCEDVSSPIDLHHPWRVGWRQFYAPHGLTPRPKTGCYANGGFVGLRREHRGFLETWQRLLMLINESFGGADVAGIPGGRIVNPYLGFAGCFGRTDQDALNAAVECWDGGAASFFNRHAMGFDPGNAMLPHALGPLKPWNRSYLRDALRGRPGIEVDFAYWKHIASPIRSMPRWRRFYGKMTQRISMFIGRFYRKRGF